MYQINRINKIFNYTIILIFVVISLFVLIEYLSLLENTFFFFKSNILKIYSFNRNSLLTGNIYNYYIFFDLSITLIFSTILIYFFQKDKLIFFIFLIKFIITIFVFPNYKINKILDEDIFFYISQNSYYFESFAFNNPYISNALGNTFLIIAIKTINLFFLNSWLTLKIFVTFLYMTSIILIRKIFLKLKIKNTLQNILLIFFSFSPSSLYISSLINKDIFIITFLILIVYALVCKKDLGGEKFFLIIFFSILIITLFRLYVGLLIVMMFFLIFFVKKASDYKYSLGFIILIVLFIYVSKNNFVTYFEIVLEHSNKANYLINNYYLFDSDGLIKSYFNNFFYLLFNSILNPFFKSLNFISIIYSVENLLFLLLLFFSITKIINKKQYHGIYLIIFIIGYGIVLSPYGYINEGTTIRLSFPIKVAIYLLLCFSLQTKPIFSKLPYNTKINTDKVKAKHKRDTKKT